MNQPQPTLFQDNPLDDLARLTLQALHLGARRLLLLSGKPIVCRIGHQLSPLSGTQRLHFQELQNLVEALLTPEQKAALDKDGACEFTGHISGKTYAINVFYGDGSHNVIIFLDEAD